MNGRPAPFTEFDRACMQRALKLAARGHGGTSPNPLVGAVIARGRRIIGEGWHKRAGEAHAEIAAIRSASEPLAEATLYVTLEPCSTHGRTPPCTGAILQHRIAEVIVAARDPNPKHSGAGLRLLKRGGVEVREGLMGEEATRLNEVFNHWIVRGMPFVHLKCAMSLDGKIATNTGESKWITGPKARAYGMRLRLGADAIMAGVNTIVRDDPALTLRAGPGVKPPKWKVLRRVIIDPNARIPEAARVLADEEGRPATIIVGENAPVARVLRLERIARVFRAPASNGGLDLRAALEFLGKEGVTSVLVEGGGETHYRFLEQELVQRVHFLYAPAIIGGRAAPKGVAGRRTFDSAHGLKLRDPVWRMVGRDLLLTARLD